MASSEGKLPEGTELYNNLFAGISLSYIPAPPLGHIVSVLSTDTVAQATRTLATANVLSAPCRDAAAADDAPWLDKYIGTVDAVNFMYWMLEQVNGAPPDSLEELLRQKFATTQVHELLDKDPDSARFSPFIPVDPDRNTVLDALLILGKYAVHRIYVVETGGDVKNIITQSRILELLNSNVEALSEVADQTLQQLDLAAPSGNHGKPVTVTLESTFWDAFQLLKQHRITGVPVVDGDGRVVGCISTRDARLLVTRPTMLRFVSQPLKMFFELQKVPFGVDALTARPTDTLRTVLARLAESHLHRIFVTDAEGRPIRVVSLRDIIAKFVKEPPSGYVADYFTV